MLIKLCNAPLQEIFILRVLFCSETANDNTFNQYRQAMGIPRSLNHIQQHLNPEEHSLFLLSVFS